jgi:hypothetical protein
MSRVSESIRRAKRFAKAYEVEAPQNNRETAMLLAGIAIGRLQMRKAIMHSMLVDTGPVEANLQSMDDGPNH